MVYQKQNSFSVVYQICIPAFLFIPPHTKWYMYVVVITHPWGLYLISTYMWHTRAFTNTIQTEWMCYNCYVLWCMGKSKVPLVCVWHEKQFYTTGPVLWNGVGGLADGKPWVSMLLIWYGFTMQTRITLLAFTNLLLMLLISWLLALYARSVICIMDNHTWWLRSNHLLAQVGA